jgi:soluble lytic murein transglycosylase
MATKVKVRSSARRAVRWYRYSGLVLLALFLFHEIAVFYLLHQRDRRIERLEKEIRTVKDEFNNLYVKHNRLKQENEQLKERQRIMDIIEEFNPGLTDAEKTTLGGVIWEESNRYGYDPVTLMALIFTESSFRPTVKSHRGAQGLMQVMPSLGRALADEVGQAHGIQLAASTQNLYDPETNVRMGSYYLFKLVLQFDDLKTAIKAYNEGPTDISRRLRKGKPMPQVYYRKFLKNYKKLQDFLQTRHPHSLIARGQTQEDQSKTSQ